MKRLWLGVIALLFAIDAVGAAYLWWLHRQPTAEIRKTLPQEQARAVRH